MRIRTLSVGMVLCTLIGVNTASAGLLTLSAVALNDPLQQQTNNPCVLGGSDCNSRRTAEINDFTVTPTGNGGANINWDLTSPGYTVGVIRLLFGNNFRVGLDFAQANGQADQVLGLFAMTINGVAQDVFVGPAAVPPTPAGNAGNGFADYVLTGFDISSFAATDIVRFHATMPVANDGPDQAFLLRGPCLDCEPTPNIPEPTTLVLFGLGLLGSGVVRKLRR